MKLLVAVSILLVALLLLELSEVRSTSVRVRRNLTRVCKSYKRRPHNGHAQESPYDDQEEHLRRYLEQEEGEEEQVDELGLPIDCGKAWIDEEPTNREKLRLVGSRNAQKGEFPAHVYIRPTNCGGVLLSKNLVLTAASCVIPERFEMKESFINLGNTELPKFPLLINYSISKFCVPQRFYTDPAYNVAVLKIQPEVDFKDNKKHYAFPACLPKGPLEEGKTVSAVGFGATEFNKISDSFVFPIHLKVLDSKLSVAAKLHPATIDLEPVKTPGSACERDEGGGVYGWSEIRQTVHGIISSYDNLCRNNLYGAADVFYLLDEIKKLISECK